MAYQSRWLIALFARYALDGVSVTRLIELYVSPFGDIRCIELRCQALSSGLKCIGGWGVAEG